MASTTYIDQVDLKVRLTDLQLIQLTDDDRTGEADAGILATVLAEASTQVDSYCAKRYQVPLKPSNQVKQLTRDVAAYMLWTRSGTENLALRDAYKAVMAMLLDISNGNASLDYTDDTQPQTSAAVALPTAIAEVFSDDNLKGWA